MKVWCANCQLVQDADVHGACETCGSFANVPIERIGWKPPKRVSRKAREVKELEKIYASSGEK